MFLSDSHHNFLIMFHGKSIKCCFWWFTKSNRKPKHLAICFKIRFKVLRSSTVTRKLWPAEQHWLFFIISENTLIILLYLSVIQKHSKHIQTNSNNAVLYFVWLCWYKLNHLFHVFKMFPWFSVKSPVFLALCLNLGVIMHFIGFAFSVQWDSTQPVKIICRLPLTQGILVLKL